MVSVIDASLIDKSLGMDYYIYEGFNLSNILEYRKSPKTFKVFEVSLDSTKASADVCVKDGIVEDLINGHLHYVLCKEGIDTFYAIQVLKRFFRGGIGYAGLKDSNSYSCQFISLYSKHLKRLKEPIKTHYSLGPIKLCFYKCLNYPVRKGYLLGNIFNILLYLKVPQEVAEKELSIAEEVLKTAILPNYYGYQRFGTIRPITHLVGRAIVKGLWGDAVELIAGSPYKQESSEVIKAREEFEAGNFIKAFRLFPSDYWIERRVCKSMALYGDPLKAINSLPIEIRNFYVEAYQSFLFNKALSNALRVLGGVKGVIDVCETLVVPGSNMVLRNDTCSSLVYEVMEVEEVNREDFVVRDLGIKCKSYVRESTFKIRDLSLKYSPEGVLLEFMLPRGSYASIVLREIFKNTVY
ncbi:MAG: tRNA pseudouridine(13) synthase TruD [Sulfolobales archaeon]